MYRIEFCLAGVWHPVGPESYDDPEKAHRLLIAWRQQHGIFTVESDKFLRVKRIEQ